MNQLICFSIFTLQKQLPLVTAVLWLISFSVSNSLHSQEVLNINLEGIRESDKDQKVSEGSESQTTKTPDAGHSYHHEVLSEGPRQAAYLMHGMPNVHFKISTSNAMAQRFFDQGLGQLHGFWFLEAERSFRQVAAFDDQSAMAYWGMAMANLENSSRAKEFIKLAIARSQTSDDREKRLVDALAIRFGLSSKEKPSKSDKPTEKASPKDKESERFLKYLQAIDKLAMDYPNEIEFKAMLAVQMWEGEKKGVKVASRMAIDAMLKEVFAANPRHPAYHFQIHLWDDSKPEHAIKAAANCGPSGSGIAHLWHMPGHTYSKLHRYRDAAWQQEASARVDHAHMMRDRLLPDQIHNYAHNQEWLVRNLNHIGRVSDAIALACNMIELPQHPKLNSFKKKGSALQGRERLIDTLVRYQYWHKALDLMKSPFLEWTNEPELQDEVISLQIIASLNESSELDNASKSIEELEFRFLKSWETMLGIESQILSRPPQLIPHDLDWQQIAGIELGSSKKSADEDSVIAYQKGKSNESLSGWWVDAFEKRIQATKSSKKEDYEQLLKDWNDQKSRLDRLTGHLCGVKAWKAAHDNDFNKAVQYGRYSKRWCLPEILVQWISKDHDSKITKTAIKKMVADAPGQLVPLATAAQLSVQMKDEEAATGYLKELRSLAIDADSDLKILELLRVTRAPDELESVTLEPKNSIPNDATRVEAKDTLDIGDRPSLDSLGPFRWNPYRAPMWSLPSNDGSIHSSKMQHGRPTILFFYLGFGCLHCVEQLKEIAPYVEKLKQEGIDCIGISNETVERLQEGVTSYREPLPIRLVANPELDVFREFRCFDDFEGQPLHGTFVIDGSGHVVWQDIGATPFIEIDFLVREAQRQLAIAKDRK